LNRETGTKRHFETTRRVFWALTLSASKTHLHPAGGSYSAPPRLSIGPRSLMPTETNSWLLSWVQWEVRMSTVGSASKNRLKNTIIYGATKNAHTVLMCWIAGKYEHEQLFYISVSWVSPDSLIHSSVYSCIHLFVYSLTLSFIPSSVRPSIHSLLDCLIAGLAGFCQMVEKPRWWKNRFFPW